MELAPCPIEFETEVLVFGSLQISFDKLTHGLCWLATSLKEQNKVLSTLCKRVDAVQESVVQETPSSPGAEPGHEGKVSAKDGQDDMLPLQLHMPAPKADSAARDLRMNARLEALERQLSGLVSQLEVQKSSTSKVDEATSDQRGRLESPVDPSQSSSVPATDAPQPLPSSDGEVSRKADLTGVFAAVEAAREIATKAAESASTGIAEAKAAAFAAKEMIEAKEKDREIMAEAVETLKSRSASLASQIAILQDLQAAQADSKGEPEKDARLTGGQTDQKYRAMQAEAPEAQSSQPVIEPKAQDAPDLQPDAKTLSSLLDRMADVEASLAKLASERSMRSQIEELQEAVRAVPHLEASISFLQQAMGGSAQQNAIAEQGERKASNVEMAITREVKEGAVQKEIQTGQTVQTAVSPIGSAQTMDLPAPAQQLEASSFAQFEERLKDLEDLNQSAESRLRHLEGANEAHRKLSTEKLSSHEGWRSSKSQPPSGGTVGGSWKDVQAELEHFRKLFEFIEGVLPRDAAEAMRFFNRRQLGKEVLSEMVSEIFGAEVEFQNAKLQLESDFKMYTHELRREFDKLSLALKALQRDTAGSECKLLDLAKRTTDLELQVRTGKMPPEETHQVSSPGEAGSADRKDRAEAGQGNEEVRKAMQDLREEVKHWLEAFKSSVIQALQTKPDNEQVLEFIKQVAAAPTGESIALFAKRQLLGKCASCETPIDVDLMRVKRPQPIGLQEPWPPGESLGAKVAIRPLNAPVSPSCSSLSRLPKIHEPRTRELAKKGMKPSPSAPEMRKETPEAQ